MSPEILHRCCGFLAGSLWIVGMSTGLEIRYSRGAGVKVDGSTNVVLRGQPTPTLTTLPVCRTCLGFSGARTWRLKQAWMRRRRRRVGQSEHVCGRSQAGAE